MLVPTVDSVRFSHLLEVCLDARRSGLLVGAAGVGKSAITTAALQALAQAGPAPAAAAASGRVAGRLAHHTIVLSAHTSSAEVQGLVESTLDRKHKNL
jgi:dynein heavy chain